METFCRKSISSCVEISERRVLSNFARFEDLKEPPDDCQAAPLFVCYTKGIYAFTLPLPLLRTARAFENRVRIAEA